MPKARDREGLPLSCPARPQITLASRPLPPRTLRRVFEHNTSCGKLVANLIGPAPVAIGTRLLALLDHVVDPRREFGVVVAR